MSRYVTHCERHTAAQQLLESRLSMSMLVFRACSWRQCDQASFVRVISDVRCDKAMTSQDALGNVPEGLIAAS